MASREQFVIRLGVDSAGVAKGIDSAVGQIQRLYGGVNNVVKGFLGLAAVRWSANMVRDAINLGSEIEDTRKRVHLTTEELQAMEYAIGKSGGSLEGMVGGMKAFAAAQIEALKGNKDLRDRLQRYGMTLDDLRKKDPRAAFFQIGSALGSAPESNQTLDDAVKLLGRGALELLPAFRDGFSEAATEAERLGLIIDRKVTGELDRAGDEIDILIRKWKKFNAEVTATAISRIRGNLQEIFNFVVSGKAGAMISDATGSSMIGGAVAQAIMAMEQQKDAQADELDPQKGGAAVGNNVRAVTSRSGAENDISSDALARIGGYRGGGGEVSRVLPQQLGELRRANGYLARIAHYSERNNLNDPQIGNTLRRVENYLRYGIDFETEF